MPNVKTKDTLKLYFVHNCQTNKPGCTDQVINLTCFPSTI